MGYEEELRLLYAVVLNALALAAAHRFARRRMGGDFVRRWVDAGLIYYLLQYVVVGALGLMGLLSPWTIGPLALMLCALLWVGSGWRHDEPTTPPARAQVPEVAADLSRSDRAVVLACFAFVAVYALAYVLQQRHIPPTVGDALTYHLPAAVQWLQTGRIGLLPTWFFNPANAYSPLGGSIFMTWLLAPVGNDVLVRYVQVGPLLLLFFVLLELCRLLGARTTTAALVAAAATMLRSFVNQVVVPKDDLFLTVFCCAAVVSLAPVRAEERSSPWRAGGALGLLLATKFTWMFSGSILLLMADVMLRARRWRRGGIAIAAALVLVIAGPWYLRNAMLTGNPLFPMDVRVAGVTLLGGLFATTRSAGLATIGEVGRLFGGQAYFGPPWLVTVPLVLAWGAAIVFFARTSVRDALWRACLFGTATSVALFVAAAPYPEVRFVFPAIAMLFPVAAGVFARIPRGVDAIAGAGLLVIVLVTTINAPEQMEFALTGFVVAGVLAAMYWFTPPRYVRRAFVGAACAVVLIVAGYAYVNWAAQLRAYALSREAVWPRPDVMGDLGAAWAAVDRDLPAGSIIAYTNTHYVYPLQGFRLTNRVVYAPVRPGLHGMHDLPHADRPLAGEHIPSYFAEQTQQGADARTWRAHLVASGADYIFVGKSGQTAPPELAFIAARLAAFELVHDNPAAAVYRIRDARALAD